MVITMTEDNFLARWSRRKRDVAEAEKAATQIESREAPAKPDEQSGTAQAEAAEPQFDPASLPPIESIDSLTDVTAFLRAGVPADLTRAALRRVWTADPAIRDFVGLAENAWDFTDPNAMPGFGPLEATDDVRRMIAQVVDQIGQAAQPREVSPLQAPQVSENATDLSTRQTTQNGDEAAREDPSPELHSATPVLLHGNTENTAVQHDATEDTAKPKQYSQRTHGRALPH